MPGVHVCLESPCRLVRCRDRAASDRRHWQRSRRSVPDCFKKDKDHCITLFNHMKCCGGIRWYAMFSIRYDRFVIFRSENHRNELHPCSKRIIIPLTLDSRPNISYVVRPHKLTITVQNLQLATNTFVLLPVGLLTLTRTVLRKLASRALEECLSILSLRCTTVEALALLLS